MISILHNLKPMHVEWKKYRIDTRARFYIEYADGREAEDYYLDVDNMHVQKGKDRAEAQFFHASKELLDEMNLLGISTNPVKREKLE